MTSATKKSSRSPAKPPGPDVKKTKQGIMVDKWSIKLEPRKFMVKGKRGRAINQVLAFFYNCEFHVRYNRSNGIA